MVFTVFYRNPEHKAGSEGFEDIWTNFEIMHEKISGDATFFTQRETLVEETRGRTDLAYLTRREMGD